MDLRRLTRDVLAADQNPPLRRGQQSGDQFQRGRLAGAIWPDDGDDLVRIRAQGHILHDVFGRGIAADDAFDIQQPHLRPPRYAS